ncbi:MAG: hypothetical protein N3A38_02960 [Planctomycetota bacterium]|nr:hypothetical protein [Planctomycetota bacterium]
MTVAATHPYALYLALSVLAIILLRLLERRRRVVVAPSILVWMRMARLQVPPQSRRPPVDISLLLLLAGAGAASVAASIPVIGDTALPSRHIALVVDNGLPSRAAGADGRTRLERALGEAAAVISGMSGSDAVSLIVTAPAADLVSGEALSPTGCAAALKGIRAAFCASSDRAALDMALDACRRRGGGVLWIGPRDPVPEVRPFPGRFISTGDGEARNVAVISIVPKELPDGRHEVWLGIRNFSKKEETGEAELLGARSGGGHGGSLAEALAQFDPPARARWQIGPGGRGGVVLTVDARGVTLLAGRIKPDGGPDAIPEDDIACAQKRLDEPLRVLTIGRGNAAVERILDILPGILRENAGTDGETRLSQDTPADLLVFVGCAPRREWPRPELIVDPPTGFGPFDVRSDVERGWLTPVPAEVDPLTRGLAELGAIFVRDPRRVYTIGAAKILLAIGEDRGGGALIGRYSCGESPRLAIFFDPAASRWAERPSWPILVARFVEEARSFRGKAGFQTYRTGTPIRISGGTGKTGVYMFDRPGVHETDLGPVAVSVLDERASDVRCSAPAAQVPTEYVAEESAIKRRTDITWLFLGLAAACLIAENFLRRPLRLSGWRWAVFRHISS